MASEPAGDHRPGDRAIRRSRTRTRPSGVVLNGEIYNFRELRDELHASGHPFRRGRHRDDRPSRGGGATPASSRERLDGMFAFAIWDARRERLMLGRDRVGQEAALLLELGRGVRVRQRDQGRSGPPGRAARARRRCDSRLPDLRLRADAARRSFDGVRSLPPGHVLTVVPGGRAVDRALLEAPPAAFAARSRTGRGALDSATAECAPAWRRRCASA